MGRERLWIVLFWEIVIVFLCFNSISSAIQETFQNFLTRYESNCQPENAVSPTSEIIKPAYKNVCSKANIPDPIRTGANRVNSLAPTHFAQKPQRITQLLPTRVGRGQREVDLDTLAASADRRRRCRRAARLAGTN